MKNSDTDKKNECSVPQEDGGTLTPQRDLYLKMELASPSANFTIETCSNNPSGSGRLLNNQYVLEFRSRIKGHSVFLRDNGWSGYFGSSRNDPPPPSGARGFLDYLDYLDLLDVEAPETPEDRKDREARREKLLQEVKTYDEWFDRNHLVLMPHQRHFEWRFEKADGVVGGNDILKIDGSEYLLGTSGDAVELRPLGKKKSGPYAGLRFELEEDQFTFRGPASRKRKGEEIAALLNQLQTDYKRTLQEAANSLDKK